MAKQRKAFRGSVNNCSCGCGRRKNPRRRFAPGCGSGSNTRHRGSANYKPSNVRGRIDRYRNFDETRLQTKSTEFTLWSGATPIARESTAATIDERDAQQQQVQQRKEEEALQSKEQTMGAAFKRARRE
jgi:hypothetical protein